MAGENPGATPETDVTTDPQTRPAEGVTPEADDGQSAAALKEALRREREVRKKFERQAADEKRRADDFAKERQSQEDEEKSEVQKAREGREAADRAKAESDRRAEAAEKALVQKLIDHEVEREAQKLGFLYPEIAPSVIDKSRVRFDPDTQRVEGAKDAVERVLKDKPGLANTPTRGGTPPPGSGGGRPSGGPGGGGQGHQTLTPHDDMMVHGNYY